MIAIIQVRRGLTTGEDRRSTINPQTWGNKQELSTTRVLQPDSGSPLKFNFPTLCGLFHFLDVGL